MRLMFSARAMDRMAGGVERMIVTIMNAMVARGHEVDLFTWDRKGAEAFYPIAPQVTWHRLDLGDPALKAGGGTRLRRAMAVRALIRRRRPQLIVAFQDGPFMALRLYTSGLGVPVIAAERNAPTRFDHTSAGRRRTITFNALRFAKIIVVQCESYKLLYPEYLRNRIVTIPNPVMTAQSMAAPDRANGQGRFQLLSVGRLSYQKNFESLIAAFASLAGRFPAWDLVILGEGEERHKLEAMIGSAGLQGRVLLPGNTPDPAGHYAASHLFCLPSRWEGFPNALAEALAHGLPAVGFSECAGVNELIRNRVNGLLADGNGDVETLSAALSALMASPQQRMELGSAAPGSVAAFAPEAVMDLWERTLGRGIEG